MRFVLFVCASCLAAPPAVAQDVATTPADRLRLIVETDAGGDPDDEQSLVRFLLYANEWDVEGIIATRPTARDGENLNTERTGLGIIRRMLNAYEECYSRLSEHDARYPSPELLKRRTVPGYDGSTGASNRGTRPTIHRSSTSPERGSEKSRPERLCPSTPRRPVTPMATVGLR